MRPFTAEGRYVNYLGDDEGSGPVAAAYGPNFARLRSVKNTYDPENIFQLESEHSAWVISRFKSHRATGKCFTEAHRGFGN